MSATALIANIQGYSIHDGPGIRTVVFLKGCPLRCRWCANPENLQDKVRTGFLVNLCQHCGRCAKACPRGAILPDPDRRIDRSLCDECCKCVEACFYGALVRYGEPKTAEETFDKVRRDKMFYDTSGGGVTVSGGEPLTHADFVAELFALCRGDGINTCVETCGCVPRSAFEKVLPLTDTFYFDLKLMDSEKHREYTGHGNEEILENARFLAGSGANLLFRQPLIPGVNSPEENVRATAEFIRSLGRPELQLQLIPYHRMGTSKYAALDIPYTLEDMKPMTGEEVEAVRALYESCGVTCTISK
ncbi:MAG: glycyl-radical enzyme activating protein [Oscillospiraceae bacterium]|nr:glycyl-radical enzyme activating protein [Oscillospiraceae bacterium]